MNVSGSTATDPRWFNQLTEIIAANQSVANRLTVEITETIAFGDLKETFSFVEALRNIGCSVAIDDFGAGFTSFRNLRDLPVNIVKLDGSFCRDLKHNAANQYLVRTLIDLTHKFDLKTIAEWVETPEDAEILKDCNVDLMQGNLFGEVAVGLPWARKEERGFTSLETAGPVTAAVEETKVFIQNPSVAPPTPIERGRNAGQRRNGRRPVAPETGNQGARRPVPQIIGFTEQPLAEAG